MRVLALEQVILADAMLKYTANSDKYSSHEQILTVLRALPPGASVLDVGTARGYIGESLAGRGYYLAGIEQNAESAGIASKFYDEFSIADIESGVPRLSRHFDAIVLADILEHLRQPLAALIHLKEHLSSGGKFIISVPNVANIWVRGNLLLGNFDYADRGILDETHLRFFTFKSICRLLKQARLGVTDFLVTPIPLPLVYPRMREGEMGHFIHRANWMMTRLWKTMFAYQFILVAAREE